MKFGNNRFGVFIVDRLGEVTTTSIWLEFGRHLIVMGIETRPLESRRYL
jgi:hypothetical protein